MKDLARLLKLPVRRRQGRPLALLLLALACALLLQLERTPLAPVRDLLFDAYQRTFPRDRSEIPAVIVAIDARSLAAEGQWPWPRTRVAELVRHILAAGPQALGIDLLFVEPDRYSPAELRRHLSLPASSVASLPEPDQELAAALASGRTVLATVGGDAGGKPSPQAPDEASASSPLHHATYFAAALGSRPPLVLHAASQGLINGALPANGSGEELGVVRRVPLVARVGDKLLPSLSLEMLRLALDAERIEVEADERSIHRVGAGDYRLPVLPNGDLALHFGRFEPGRLFSAADVLAGKVAAENFAGRFVLLGLAGLGLQDQVVTPLGGRRIPGVDVHAQVIESLLSGKAARRPWGMAMLEAGILLAGGLLLVAFVPRSRPVPAGMAAGGLLILLPAAGFAAFGAGAWLFDGLSVALLLLPCALVLVGNAMAETEAQRQAAQRDLQASREAEARLGGELNAARRIQMGLLPDPKLASAGEERLEIAALLKPAKAVGGDYYDCFRLDRDRFCFAIGDVAGKGVPASLFMSMAKTLTGALARRNADLGQAVQEVAAELDRQNPEMLFVTAFVAVLDLATGKLEFVCAGHDAPLRVRAGQVERLDTAAAAGPPLCSLPDFPYGSGTAQLQPGDELCLFTDGVTEASDGEALYGAARLAAFLAAQRGPLDATVEALLAEVRAFEAGCQPADDLTVLLLRWQGLSAISAR